MNPRFDSLDCTTTRQALELVRAGDPTDSGVAASAAQHLRECPECQIVVGKRAEFDAHIGAAFRDVPVPADLKSRILAGLERSAVQLGGQSTALPPVPPSDILPLSTVPGFQPARRMRSTRRWLLRLSVAAVALIGVGLGLWWTKPFGMTELLDDMVAQIASDEIDPAAFPALADDAAFPLPATMVTRYLTEVPRQFGSSSAALYLFQLPSRQQRSEVACRLLVVPVARLQVSPTATSFREGAPVYFGRYCTRAWVEGELAFVCLVQGGEDEMQRLIPRGPVAI
ncbi:MAG: hypothetical protein ACKV0T_08355 [Planctomycetales bacterium]